MKIENNLHHMRQNYEQGELNIQSVYPSPYRQFEKWLSEAMQEPSIKEPNAMLLGTATPNGMPSSRVVLLKEFTENGFVFFTNYNSRKGQELLANPNACLNFWWSFFERQIRIEGFIEKIAPEQSDAYFYSRPIGSQAGAVSSPQSQIVESREWLEQQFIEAQLKGSINRPPHWGGYILNAHTIEFWQGRSNRLHDRLRYSKTEKNDWEINRLAP